MDVDAFVEINRPDWERMNQLARTRRLRAAEIDELMELYGKASTHLSVVQAQDPDGAYATGLSLMVVRARTRITAAPAEPGRIVSDFLLAQLPAAFYQIRWLTVIIGVLFCAVAGVVAAWVYHDPVVLNTLMTPEQQEAFVGNEFVDYYSEHPGSAFASLVWTNNAWIAAQAVVFGITGVYVPYILVMNAVNVGVSAGVMAVHGELGTFFLYILPHGFMELTAIFIAAAAGLRIFWAWVAPGRRFRTDAVAAQGRALVTVAMGLVAVLFVSALVEAFVTPSNLPHPVRLGIGIAVLAGYWVYTLVLGRRAVRAGHTGDLTAVDAGATRMTS